MVKYIKICFAILINIGYGFLVSYLFPVFLLIAMNRLKGAGNNPDGELLVPFGWIMVFLLPALYFVVFRISKKHFIQKNAWMLAIPAFIVGAAIGVMTINMTETVNYSNLLSQAFM
ncbi:MAG: hypothetical protein LBI19_04375 [Oscillospiraceae bacterium]|jgi:hypothetical protein|nr:hypothetical protein [Oscillospiraceae bacterium]